MGGPGIELFSMLSRVEANEDRDGRLGNTLRGISATWRPLLSRAVRLRLAISSVFQDVSSIDRKTAPPLMGDRIVPGTRPSANSSGAPHFEPYKDSHHPRYTPLQKVSAGAIKDIGAKVSGTDKGFLDPGTDKS